jgi:hypothetical protein
MHSQHCAATDTPDTLWSFCPNIGAAYAFAIFFGLTFIVHVVQGILYRKVYTWVIAMSAFWQFVAYVFRIISINAPANLGNYAAWFVLILVAPLWTNAFVYVSISQSHAIARLTFDADGAGENGLEFHSASQSVWHYCLELHNDVRHPGHRVRVQSGIGDEQAQLTLHSAFVVQVYGAAATQGKGISRAEILQGKTTACFAHLS